jgi:hypothetical protein
LVIRLAVVVDFGVGDGFGLAIAKGESFIEIWAVWKAVDGWTPVGILLVVLLLMKLVV